MPAATPEPLSPGDGDHSGLRQKIPDLDSPVQ